MRYINGDNVRRGGVVITPTDVELQLVELTEQLDRGNAILQPLAEELAEVTLLYDLGVAQSIAGSGERSLDRRKAEALLACRDLYERKVRLEAKCRLLRDSQHDVRVQLEAVRSIGASVRSVMAGEPGFGGSPRAR